MADYKYEKLTRLNRVVVYKDGELVTVIEKFKHPMFNKTYYRIPENGEVFRGIKEAKKYVEENF